MIPWKWRELLASQVQLRRPECLVWKDFKLSPGAVCARFLKTMSAPRFDNLFIAQHSTAAAWRGRLKARALWPMPPERETIRKW